jgi:hypothetical protein
MKATKQYPIAVQKSSEAPVYKLPFQGNKLFKRSDLFSDNLPEYLTLKDIERIYRDKPQRLRNLLSRHHVAGLPSPFLVLSGHKPLLVKRISYEDFLLRESNAIPIPINAPNATIGVTPNQDGAKWA